MGLRSGRVWLVAPVMRHPLLRVWSVVEEKEGEKKNPRLFSPFAALCFPSCTWGNKFFEFFCNATCLLHLLLLPPPPTQISEFSSLPFLFESLSLFLALALRDCRVQRRNFFSSPSSFWNKTGNAFQIQARIDKRNNPKKPKSNNCLS